MGLQNERNENSYIYFDYTCIELLKSEKHWFRNFLACRFYIIYNPCVYASIHMFATATSITNSHEIHLATESKIHAHTRTQCTHAAFSTSFSLLSFFQSYFIAIYVKQLIFLCFFWYKKYENFSFQRMLPIIFFSDATLLLSSDGTTLCVSNSFS